jgi:hypothetical protein
LEVGLKNKALISGLMAILAAILALAILSPQFMVSPGRLSKAHATLGEECFACHQAFSGASPQKCLFCHEIAKDGRIATKGAPPPAASRRTPFHHALATNNCVACHTEHEGVRAYRGDVAFSHEALQSSVRDACGACHERPTNGVHQRSVAQCDSCHAQDKWKPAKFDHSNFFALDSRHNVACTACHPGKGFQKYTCYGCHEHSRDAMAALHRREGVRNSENCVTCHRSSGEEGKGNDD